MAFRATDKGITAMKRIMIAGMVVVAVLLEARADETYKEFLRLRTVADEAKGVYYQAVTNGELRSLGKWTDGGVCVSTPANGCITNSIGVLTNIEYFVSRRAAFTNVNSIAHHYRSGVKCIFRYSGDKRVSSIEDCGPVRGDFRCYFAGKDGDLGEYVTVTNFFAAHGVRHYKKGEVVSEEKKLVDFSVFK